MTAVCCFALGAASTWANPAGAVNAFGTVIDQPGNYFLTTDLDSGGAAGPAIAIVADDVHLDLQGHSITGNGDVADGDNLGIWVAGTADDPRSRVKVSNGSVSQVHYGVWLDYTTQSHVTEMTLNANRGGIGLNFSSGNHLNWNSSFGNTDGILLQQDSDKNVVSHNDCSGNGFSGIFLNAPSPTAGCDNNQIIKNVCSQNRVVGIWLNRISSGNRIVNNTVNQNHQPTNPFFLHAGIAIGHPLIATWVANNNIVVANTALGNTTEDSSSWDVFDSTPCENLWRGNVFEVDNETGAAAGPKNGCMR